MRKVLLIAAATVGGVVILIAGLLIYAALNLNSIVKSDRQEPLVVVRLSLAAEIAKTGAGRPSTLTRNALPGLNDAFSELDGQDTPPPEVGEGPTVG